MLLMNVEVRWALNRNFCVSLGIQLAFQLESHISLMLRWASTGTRSHANPQILSLVSVFNNFGAYVDLKPTVGFNFIITHMQIHSYPEKAGIKEVVLRFSQENWDRIWDVVQRDIFLALPLETSARLHSAKLPNSGK